VPRVHLGDDLLEGGSKELLRRKVQLLLLLLLGIVRLTHRRRHLRGPRVKGARVCRHRRKRVHVHLGHDLLEGGSEELLRRKLLLLLQLLRVARSRPVPEPLLRERCPGGRCLEGLRRRRKQARPLTEGCARHRSLATLASAVVLRVVDRSRGTANRRMQRLWLCRLRCPPADGDPEAQHGAVAGGLSTRCGGLLCGKRRLRCARGRLRAVAA